MTELDLDFVEDLKNAMLEEYKIMEPQQKNEFSVRWFSENILKRKWDIAKAFLEGEVQDGRMSVRRHVQITWEKRGKKSYGDVYKWIKAKKKGGTRRPK